MVLDTEALNSSCYSDFSVRSSYLVEEEVQIL